MRILIANNYYYLRGGAERVMFNDMRALAARGADVVPFSVADPANIPTSYSAGFTRGAEVHATRPLRRLRAAREAIHCRGSARDIASLIEKLRPDILHCHNIYGRLSTSILPVARRYKLPVVLTVHDYKVVCPAYLMLRDGKPCTACVDGGYYRCAVHRCHKRQLAASVVYSVEAYYARLTDSYGAVSAFLCPSLFIAELLVKSGVDRRRVIHHPNSVDPCACKPHYEGEYVLYAGRLSREKGIATLIDALKGTGIPLRIAGSGPIEDSLRTQAAGRPGRASYLKDTATTRAWRHSAGTRPLSWSPRSGTRTPRWPFWKHSLMENPLWHPASGVFPSWSPMARPATYLHGATGRSFMRP